MVFYRKKIGEHIGDWEHVTLRVSNFDGELKKVYLSQHSNGQWVEASQLEFQSGNKSVCYSSLNGHAIYPKAGLVMQGLDGIGIKNETKKSEKVIDMGVGFEVVSGEYLGSAIVEPPWLNFLRQWRGEFREHTCNFSILLSFVCLNSVNSTLY